MTKVVILAAGKGTRMNDDLPKVLVPINGRPMIEYLVKSVIQSEVDLDPIIVVSPDNHEIIKEALKKYNCQYAVQDKQLGTGHAIACAEKIITSKVDHVISFYGDHPFVKSETIRNLSLSNSGCLCIVTTKVEDFNDWRKNFYHWGRILRYNDRIEAIIEFKDATEEIKKITEINPGFYCFNNYWLKKNINKLKNNNAQHEYYLTDLAKIAFEQGMDIGSFLIDPKEAIGINSKEELEIAESLIEQS